MAATIKKHYYNLWRPLQVSFAFGYKNSNYHHHHRYMYDWSIDYLQENNTNPYDANACYGKGMDNVPYTDSRGDDEPMYREVSKNKRKTMELADAFRRQYMVMPTVTHQGEEKTNHYQYQS
jgi:hypothetical protein